MIRFLSIACVVLVILCVLEGLAVRRLKADLVSVDARAAQAALIDVQGRRDEVLRTLSWIDATLRADGTSGHAVSLCQNSALDVDLIGRWLFDTYLLARAKGGTEIAARQRVVDGMRASVK